ncbi:alpha/beta fold hydrolase [Pseudoalteromonas sp. MMG010]|uniref:alpha/beta fold hydrolase n=1 Tax=Pseudoalteromonas sp. MMG010 TaxID=2822685 RepID=UPI001B39D2D3|nr:alpha/beta fold hydrolase [Pseudoalteromonas sp. MMG010]MBQ4832747.1 alpha/beta fold hydrolase [Pseudoalteromonas sp. MMG010]
MFYSTEADIEQNLTAIEKFYDSTLNKAYLTTPTGDLFYAYALPEHAKYAIVFSSGRIEGLDKYQELLWELYNNNIAVFILDHQGQGRSYRHLANPHKGFVHQFSDYSADFSLFNQKIVDSLWQGKKFLVAHSMGGAIALDYLSQYSHSFSGAYLSAPMLDVHTKGIPKPLAKLAASSAKLFGLSGAYAIGQKNYLPVDFTLNVLTSSKIRYGLFRKVYQQTPLLQLGGVTYGWLNSAFSFIACVNTLELNNLPVYIASAENDEVVDNQAQHALAKRLNNVTLRVFNNAKHELFFERDEVRKPLLTSLYKFTEGLLSTDNGSK